MDNRNRLAIKIAAAQRLLMCNLFSGSLPLYIVTEYPKSGGTWFSRMLADYLNLPFPRNQRPRFESCIMHGHYLYSPFFRNVFFVIRDGRDVMVSAYYHMLFQNEHNSPSGVAQNRKIMPFTDYDNIQKNLPAFIEYMFIKKSQGLFQFRWDEFILSWWDKDVPLIRYEDLLTDSAGVLYRTISHVTGQEPDSQKLSEISDRFSFKNLAKRQAGEEDSRSFLRKGIAGDWKNKFTKESREIFDYYAGETLVEIGYEPNKNWVTQIEPDTAEYSGVGQTQDVVKRTG